MRAMVTDALDAGFVGLSTDRLRFSKLEGTRFAGRQLPSTYATWREYGALYDVVRRRGAVVQSNLDVEKRPETIMHFLLSGARPWRRSLKTTLLAAFDLKSNRSVIKLLKAATGGLNPLLRSQVNFQLLAVPFHLYSDGMDLVIFEEFASGTAALDIRDQLQRVDLIKDEGYRRKFRKEMAQKYGVVAWNRDMYDTEIVGCPDESVVGKSFDRWPTPAVCSRWTRSSISFRSTPGRCVGIPPSPTTAPMFSMKPSSIGIFSWVTTIPART